jgi:hypothetical protein
MSRTYRTLFHTITIAITVFISFAVSRQLSAESDSYIIRKWEISQDEAVKTYLPGSRCTTFKPYSTKEYENKMFMQIIQINPESGPRFTAVKTDSKPYRELLFYKGKFVMLTEEHSKVDDLSFKKIFVDLKNAYGLPRMTKENSSTIYTFTSESATAVLQADGNAPYEVKIFIYGKALFREIFTLD